MSKLALTAAFVFTLVMVETAHSDGDATAGESKSATCVACHGVDGNSTNPEWPNLAGQHADYLSKQLADYKQGETRNNALMAPIVAELSPEDMNDLAAYYASQAVAGGVANEDSVSLGERIYRAGNLDTGLPACMACHGPSGAGVRGAGFPAVAGQHATYTATQLTMFQASERSNDRNAMMRQIAQRMTDEEIKAVSDYIAGLH